MSGLFQRLRPSSVGTAPSIRRVRWAVVATAVLVVACGPAVPTSSAPTSIDPIVGATPGAPVVAPSPTASAVAEATTLPTPSPDPLEGLTITKPEIPNLPKGSKAERKFLAAASDAGFTHWYPTVIEIKNDRLDAAAWVTVRGAVESGGRSTPYERSYWVMPGHSDVQAARVPTRQRSTADLAVVSVEWVPYPGQDGLGKVEIGDCDGYNWAPRRGDGPTYSRAVYCRLYNRDELPVAARFVVRIVWSPGSQRFPVARCEATEAEAVTVAGQSFDRLLTAPSMTKCVASAVGRGWRAWKSGGQFWVGYEYAREQPWASPSAGSE